MSQSTHALQTCTLRPSRLLPADGYVYINRALHAGFRSFTQPPPPPGGPKFSISRAYGLCACGALQKSIPSTTHGILLSCSSKRKTTTKTCVPAAGFQHNHGLWPYVLLRCSFEKNAQLTNVLLWSPFKMRGSSANERLRLSLETSRWCFSASFGNSQFMLAWSLL